MAQTCPQTVDDVKKDKSENNGKMHQHNVENGEFLFFKTFEHYQTGDNQMLNVDARTIDLSFVHESNLSHQSGNNYSVDLFKLNPTKQSSLALGKISLFYKGNHQYYIKPDKYDFNIEWNRGYSFRNIATAGAGLLHNWNLQPLFVGGSFTINFYGTVTFKP
jgi:hypothetical protein